MSEKQEMHDTMHEGVCNHFAHNGCIAFGHSVFALHQSLNQLHAENTSQLVFFLGNASIVHMAVTMNDSTRTDCLHVASVLSCAALNTALTKLTG